MPPWPKSLPRTVDNVSKHQKVWCQNYDDCLDEAAITNRSFICRDCREYKQIEGLTTEEIARESICCLKLLAKAHTINLRLELGTYITGLSNNQ